MMLCARFFARLSLTASKSPLGSGEVFFTFAPSSNLLILSGGKGSWYT